jgi:hypothetical protein
MNRREMFSMLGVSGWTAYSALRGFLPEPSYLDVRVTPKTHEPPFAVEEFAADGRSAGCVRCDDERSLTLFLGRTIRDPAAPRRVRLTVTDGNSLERVWMAVRACRAAGITQVRYFGCIPPGCGILTGATSHQPRLNGIILNTEWLEKTLERHSTYC